MSWDMEGDMDSPCCLEAENKEGPGHVGSWNCLTFKGQEIDSESQQRHVYRVTKLTSGRAGFRSKTGMLLNSAYCLSPRTQCKMERISHKFRFPFILWKKP